MKGLNLVQLTRIVLHALRIQSVVGVLLQALVWTDRLTKLIFADWMANGIISPLCLECVIIVAIL